MQKQSNQWKKRIIYLLFPEYTNNNAQWNITFKYNRGIHKWLGITKVFLWLTVAIMISMLLASLK